MIRHEPVLPSEDICPIDDWRLIETRLNLKTIAQTETMFATANGYLGMRGAFEEGGPAGQHGTFINGLYESWPIPYGESAFGFARHGQTIVNVPDGKIIRLYIDDEPFDLESAFVQRYERVLDMQNGTLDREVAGLRDHQGRISFNPTNAKDLRFKLTVRGCRLMVDIRDDAVTYRLEQGDHFTFWHREEEIVLKNGQSQRRDL